MAASPQPAAALSVSACPVRLGHSAEQASASTGYTGVQYNHKPTISKRTTVTIDLPSSSTQLKTLKLVDGDEQYIYRGTQSSKDHTYILIPDDDGPGYTLERLDSSFRFNLAKAPWESNASKLAQEYTQLSSTADDEEEQLPLGSYSDDDSHPHLQEDADPNNPFDYRHYLNPSGSPSPQTHPTKGSVVGTPLSIASQASPRTTTQPARTARKPTSAFAPQDKKTKLKPKPKPVERAQVSSDRVKTSPEPEKHQNIPKVRIDRRASTRVAVPSKGAGQQKSLRKTTDDELTLDMDDDGDLILEGDEPTSHRNSQRSLGLALSGALGENSGPRSLKSAASSPASHNESPLRPRGLRGLGERHGDTDGEDVEMEDTGAESIDEFEDVDADAESSGELHLEDSDANDYVDEDVDDLHLPSPAQVHRPSVSDTVVFAADDDDDLENQMLLALEGGDDDVPEPGQQQHADSEEESEEE